jgi:hypothetical protein
MSMATKETELETPRQPQTGPRSTFFSLDGRVDPLELVIHAPNESGATGVARLPDHRE